MKDLTNNIDEC